MNKINIVVLRKQWLNCHLFKLVFHNKKKIDFSKHKGAKQRDYGLQVYILLTLTEKITYKFVLFLSNVCSHSYTFIQLFYKQYSHLYIPFIHFSNSHRLQLLTSNIKHELQMNEFN